MSRSIRKAKVTSAKSSGVTVAQPAGAEVALKAERASLGTVSFQLVNPSAKKVYVAGSFNEWNPEKTPLNKIANGRWARDLAVRPGRHEYLFVVDGEWLPDPSAQETVTNPFGGKNCVLTVSE